MSAALLLAPWVVVVDVGGDGEIERSDVSQAIARQLDHRIVPPLVDREISDRLEVDRSMAECGLEPPCLADRLAGTGAGLGLFVDVNLSLAPPVVSALLVDVPRRDSFARAIELAKGTARADLLPAIERAVETLLDRAGFGPAGRVHFEVEPGVQILLGSEPLSLPTAKLAPGEYRARAIGPSFPEVEVTFRVEAGTEHRVVVERPTPIYQSPWL